MNIDNKEKKLCFDYLWILLSTMIAPKTKTIIVKKIKKTRDIEKAVNFLKAWEAFTFDIKKEIDKLRFKEKEGIINFILFILRKSEFFQIPLPPVPEEVQKEIDKQLRV